MTTMNRKFFSSHDRNKCGCIPVPPDIVFRQEDLNYISQLDMLIVPSKAALEKYGANTLGDMLHDFIVATEDKMWPGPGDMWNACEIEGYKGLLLTPCKDPHFGDKVVYFHTFDEGVTSGLLFFAHDGQNRVKRDRDWVCWPKHPKAGIDASGRNSQVQPEIERVSGSS